jgi:hypothetical protein
MPTYIQHDADGNITAVINTQQQADGIEVDEAMAAHISPLTHHVAIGGLVTYGIADAASKADRPRHAIKWDNAAMQWVMPYDIDEKRTSDAISTAASERALLLGETDWLVIRSMETGGEVPAPWTAYRQALRDITQQPGYPLNIVWPERPEAA